MPILSNQDQRDYYQNMRGPQEAQEDPTFFETMGSAFDFVIDEELSVSSLLNRQGYNDRNEQIFKMTNEGFDLKPYTDVTGEIDYDRISDDTGLIKNNLELYNERTEILRKRREENQDVVDRGNGIAQFIGSMGGYMLDPINVATMGIGVGTAYKGMSTLSRALMTGRNTAAIAVASESAIQPLVYKHKHDIGSPYEFNDALMAIGTTAIGAGLLGGAMGGVAGYFTRLSEDASKFVSFKPIDKVDVEVKLTPEQESINVLQRMGAQLVEQKAELPPRIEDDILQEWDNFQAGQYTKLEDARDATIITLEKQAETIRKENLTLARWIAKEGGLNKERWAREGIDVADMKAMGGGRNPLFRVKGGYDPDMLAERLREGNVSDIQMNDAIDMVDEMVRNPKIFKDAGVQSRIDDIDDNINILRDENTVLEEYYGNVIRKNVESDMELLAQNKAFEDAMNKPTLTYDDYVVEQLPPAPQATRTGLQREQLDSEGLAANYDRDIANFEAQENRLVYADGKLVDGDEYMKALDDQIEGIESVRVCAIG
tara:strand:- start:2709 stop:4337 length:1629 start_codon:yes stop_codon:yes gene_type:complete